MYRIFNLKLTPVTHSIDIQQNSRSLKSILTLEEFHDIVLPMLITLGPGLHRDPVLMFKTVRIVREALINVSVLKSSIFYIKLGNLISIIVFIF